MKDTGEVLKATAPQVLDEQIQAGPDGQLPPLRLPQAQQSWKEEFDLEINWARWKVTVEVINDPGVSDWIRVFDTGAAGDVRQLGVSLSLSHPFMERFVGTDFDRIRTIRPREKGDEQGKSWTHNRVCAGQYGISRFLRPPRIVKSLLLATLSSNARSLSRIQKSGNAATVRHGNVRKMRCGPGFLAPH